MKNDGMSVPSGIYYLGAQTKEQNLASGCVAEPLAQSRA